MLIRYSKFDEATRDRIRALESKGHIGYIRYLLMRRWPYAKINGELMGLGLSWVEEDDLRMYFKLALYPIIQQFKLDDYYKHYRDSRPAESLAFHATFQRSEKARENFCLCIIDMEIDFFFSNEILEHYGSRDHIPHRDGKPIIHIEKVPDFTEVLNHPKRHIIEAMLIEGRTPKMISDLLDKSYDIQLPARDILMFASAFFKTKRRDLERTIDDLQDEVQKLNESIYVIRNTSENKMSIGAKSTAIANIKIKIEQLEGTIKRLMGHHSHSAFNAGLLEYAQIREMFADVMIRSHRRFQDLDGRTEDEVVAPLKAIVDTMAKATDKIMSLDDRIQATTKKDISEEMLEVIMPSLDRVLEEEREAHRKYHEEFGGESPLEALKEADSEPEILGIDD